MGPWVQAQKIPGKKKKKKIPGCNRKESLEALFFFKTKRQYLL
jgi:hypothetical protein